MNKLAGFLALAMVCVPQAAFCGPDSDSIGKLAAGMTGKSKEDLAKSILVCARDLVDRKLGGVDGVKVAGELISSARANADNREELGKLNSLCENTLKSATKADITRDQQFEAAKALSGSCGARAMLEDFIKPKVSCKKGGVAASAAITLGVGLKVDVAKCDATDGHRWLELGLGVGVGAGLGIEADLNGGTLERGRRGYSKNPFQVSKSTSVAAGVLIIVKGESDKDITQSNDAPVEGLGVGVGPILLTGGQLDIEVVPLGTSRNSLYDRLMRSESDSCAALASRDTAAPTGSGPGTNDAVATLDDAQRGSKGAVGVSTGKDTSGRTGQGERAI